MSPRARTVAGRAEDGESRTDRARDWFAMADSSFEGVATWDCKLDLLGQAVLDVLGAGCAVMFGITRDSRSVSITVFDGDRKSRVYCGDSIELDDAMSTLRQTALGRASGQGS